MCRGLGEKNPRRCPNCSPTRRRAAQRNRYALKKARKLHPDGPPAQEPVAPPVVPEADLRKLIESVKIVAGSIFREVHKGESTEDNIAFQRRRQDANRGLNETYGSIDQAAIAVGGLVATRAEELSGTSADKVKRQYEDRLVEAEARYEAAMDLTYVESEEAIVWLARVKRGD